MDLNTIKKMKILIIEDEPRAANQLQSILSKCEVDYEVLDIIDSIEEAVNWFKENEKPKLIFMDIQLADGLSFEIFQKVEVDSPIIFTTAFDQYAIQAFKVNSIDYLLKPIQEEDLTQALTKFNNTTNLKNLNPQILELLLDKMQSKETRMGLLVKDGSSFVQIKISDFDFFYSRDSMTFGVVKSKRHTIEETMDQMFKTLDENEFYRINRGQIIAKKSIQKIEPYFNHRLKVSVANATDQEFIVSRQKSSDFKNWLNS